MRPASSAGLFLRKRFGGRRAPLRRAGTRREREGGGRHELGSAVAARLGPARSFPGCVPRLQPGVLRPGPVWEVGHRRQVGQMSS